MFCSEMKGLADKLEEEATNIHADEPSTARRGAEYALRIMAEHIREQVRGAIGEYELCQNCQTPLETRMVKSPTVANHIVPISRCPKCQPLEEAHVVSIDLCEGCKYHSIATCMPTMGDPAEEILYCDVEDVDVETLMREGKVCVKYKPEQGDSHHCPDCNTELNERDTCPACTDASRHDL